MRTDRTSTLAIRTAAVAVSMIVGAALAVAERSYSDAQPVILCQAVSGGDQYVYFSSTTCPMAVNIATSSVLNKYTDPPGFYTPVHSTLSGCGGCYYDIAFASNSWEPGYFLTTGAHAATWPGYTPGYATTYWYFVA